MTGKKGESKKVREVVHSAESLLRNEPTLPIQAITVIRNLLEVTKGLVKQLGLNSNNSSIPPSQDPNRKKRKVKRESQVDNQDTKVPVSIRLKPQIKSKSF